MTLLDVGVENLPNVYIDKILISPTRITITCLIKDNRNSKSWRGRSQMSNMHVKVLCLDDRKVSKYNEITHSLNNGLKSLHDYKTNADSLFIKKEAASAFTFRPQNNLDLSFYYKDFIFDNPGGGNVVTYAACYMEGFNFENDQFNKFYGPMSSEYIFRAGAPNVSSGYFYLAETGEEYGGPVHSHAGKYMEGSKHGSHPHEELVYLAEKNSKIVEI